MDQKIGQLFIVAVPLIYDEKELLKTVENYIDLGVGGLMVGVGGKHKFLETRGVTDIKKVKTFVSKTRNMDPDLFIAIDAEGGDDFNLFKGITRLKHARDYGEEFERTGSTKEYEKDIDELIEIMLDCRININFSPILGIAQAGYKGYLSEGKRSFSDKEETVKVLSEIAIEKMQKNNIISVAKCFPGYGSIDKNPHLHLARQKRNDPNPVFISAIRDNLGALMKGHVLSYLDEEKPATVSSKIDGYLREELNFEGLSIADEIFMGALSEFYGGDVDGTHRIIDTIQYNDMIILSYPKQNQKGRIKLGATYHDHFLRLRQATTEAHERGEINEQEIEESYQRIKKLKHRIA